MQICALVFDAYGTIFDVNSVVAQCEQFWPGRAFELSKLWRQKQLEYTWQRSLMGRYVPFDDVTRDALQFCCHALRLDLDTDRTDALMRSYLELTPYQDAQGTLARIRDSGRKLALLTNGSSNMIEGLVRHADMESTFDALLTVDGIGSYKPAPSAYAIAVDHFGLPAPNIGFVSSNCWDALGAKAFGLPTFWINRFAEPVDNLGVQLDGELGGLDDLAQKLNDLELLR